jgi:TonB family protein
VRAALVVAVAIPFLIGSPASGNYTPAHVDQSVANQPIDFPYDLRVRGVEGSAILKVHVSYLGHPDQVQIVQSTGDKDLDAVAESGVLNWHYVAANRDGENVSDWAVVRVDFKIDRSVAPPPPVSKPKWVCRDGRCSKSP